MNKLLYAIAAGAVLLSAPKVLPAVSHAFAAPNPSASVAARQAGECANDESQPQAFPGAVSIDTATDSGSSFRGTGIALDRDTVLTNSHVVDGASLICVVTDADHAVAASVVGQDRGHDIAVLRLAGPAVTVAALGDSSTVRRADHVTAMGNNADALIGEGLVERLGATANLRLPNGGGTEHLTGLVEITGGILPGDSGGPLLNTAGRVIGVNTGSGVNGAQGVAIPINDAVAYAKQSCGCLTTAS